MTITLGLWQIVALILLILVVVAILKRLVWWIAMGRSIHWSNLQPNLIDQINPSTLTIDQSESGSEKPYFTVDGIQMSLDGGRTIYRKYRDGREEYFPAESDREATILNAFRKDLEWFASGHEPSKNHSPEDGIPVDEINLEPTGITPGGVSYTQVPQGVRIGHARKDFRSLMRMKGSK